MMFITPEIHKHNTSSAQANNVVYLNKEAYIKMAAFNALRASSTVEAALVIPLFIYAVMAVMYFIQVMAVRSHVNDALYITLKKSAGYAYIYENFNEYAGQKAIEDGIADDSTIDSAGGGIKKGMVVETIRRMFIKELGKDYAKNNNIENGDAGFIFISSRVLQGNSVIDIKVSYYIKNPFDIFGNTRIKIADRKRINAWLGEDMDGYKKADGMSEEYVYITAGGEVYHTDSKCTHLLRYIKKCDKGDIEEIRNNSGSKYYECKMCKKNTDDQETDDQETGDTKTNSVYYTEYGTCFHSNSMCTELRRNIQKVKKSDIEDRKLCEKCSG